MIKEMDIPSVHKRNVQRRKKAQSLPKYLLKRQRNKVRGELNTVDFNYSHSEFGPDTWRQYRIDLNPSLYSD